MPMDEWNPFEELVQLRKRFQEVFERSFFGNLDEDPIQQQYWQPPIDVYRDEDRVVIEVELPGLDRERTSVELRGNNLVIRGDRPPADASSQAVYHRLERRSGPFERIIHIGEPVAVDDIRASYHAGVLTVELPLRHGPVQRRIELSD